MQGRVEPAPEVFGRDSELTALRGLVAADRRVGALLLTGAAGIGKTALWEAGLEMARAAGRVVLAARPAGTEAGMAFAGLIDLCDRVGPEVLVGKCQGRAQAHSELWLVARLGCFPT